MKKIVLLACLLALLLCGCGAGEETTLSGMVFSVEGNTVQLLQMDGTGNRFQMAEEEIPSGPQGEEGERPSMPAGEAGQWSDFVGGEGEQMPSLPEGETMPQRPEGGEDMPTLPEGETMPEGMGGDRPGSMNMEGMEENTVTVDLSNAHITVEFDGGKATGAMSDITQGSFLTITMVDGKATNAIVSQGGGIGGFGGSGGRGNGDRPGGNRENSTQAAS